MASIFPSMFINLKTKILADIPDSQAVPGIRLVDLDLGQIDFASGRPPISSGGNLYIDFIQTTYLQKQGKAQWGEMIINFRLVFDPWSKSHSLMPDETITKGLAYFEIEQKLYQCIQDFATQLMIPMKRISATSEKRDDDNLRVRNIQFKATYEDRSLQV